MILKFLIFFVVLTAAFCKILIQPDARVQRCNLKEIDINKTWVYAIYNGGQNNFDILHTDYLQDQQILYLICDNTNIVGLKCQQGVLDPLPANAICKKRLRASVTAIGWCVANNMSGVEYEVAYDLPQNSRSVLYNICYSRTNESVLYATHYVYGSHIPATNYKRPDFTQGQQTTRDRAESFQKHNVSRQFEKLLGPGQQYIPTANDSKLERGHLANTQDFLTSDQKNETFRYINAMPQFGPNNRGNWLLIENWINKLPQSNGYAKVVTGTYGVLELPNTNGTMISMYLLDNYRNPIPLWTYKVVSYQGACYAFITLNNVFNTNKWITADICRSINCPYGLQFDQLTTEKGVSYCCEPKGFVQKVGAHAGPC